MAYWTAFPESHAKMDDTFKQDLLNVVHEWVTGNRTSPSLSLQLSNFIFSLRSLLKHLTKPHTKIKSGDLSIMHNSNVLPRRKLSSHWLKTHVTEQRVSLYLCEVNVIKLSLQLRPCGVDFDPIFLIHSI